MSDRRGSRSCTAVAAVSGNVSSCGDVILVLNGSFIVAFLDTYNTILDVSKSELGAKLAISFNHPFFLNNRAVRPSNRSLGWERRPPSIRVVISVVDCDRAIGDWPACRDVVESPSY